ncbi:MAG: hypothetical protein EB079_03920 [Verrucomicrobia bacterium]|nr:hypothetical protein [Verrucomicrobiota bacterium]
MRYIKLFEEFETSQDSYYIVLKTPIEDWEKSGTIDNIEELKALSHAEQLQENDPTSVYLIFDEKGKGLMHTKVKLGLLSRLALGYRKGYKRG